MKRDLTNDTDPIPAIDQLTEPGVAPGVSAAPREVPSDLDPKTARILKALDRPPRPPAPTPELRASSDGGDFVAYSGATRLHGAAPRTDEERRRQVLAELSVLVQEPPASETPPHGSTSTVAPHSHSQRPMWGGLLIGAFILASVIAAWGSLKTKTVATSPQLRPAQSTAVTLLPPRTQAPSPAPKSPALPDTTTGMPPPVTKSTFTPTPKAPTPIVSGSHLLEPPRQPAKQPSAPRRGPPAASSPAPPSDQLIEHPW
jgi:hypothetical protein